MLVSKLGEVPKPIQSVTAETPAASSGVIIGSKLGALPSDLDEKVAALHLAKLGVELEVLRDDQAAYIGVPVEGPFKPEYYRY